MNRVVLFLSFVVLQTLNEEAASFHFDGGHSETCAPGFFGCNDGFCIPQNWLCDGAADCKFGEDEGAQQCKHQFGAQPEFSLPLVVPQPHIHTTPAPSSRLCPPDFFFCDHKCFHNAYRCDGARHCHDSSDERGCPHPTEDPCVDKTQEFTQRCLELCLGITKPNCSKPTSAPIVLLPLTTTPKPKAFCERGFDLVGTRCVQEHTSPPKSHAWAQKECAQVGASLVTILTGNDFIELVNYLNTPEREAYSYWTDASDQEQEGKWIWKSIGKRVHDYTPLWNQHKHEKTGRFVQAPDGGKEQNCGLLESCPFRYLNDDDCERKKPYICQKDPILY